MSSICFLFTLLLSYLTVSYGQTCASGWTLYGSTCYSFSGSGTWAQCFSYCPSSYPGAMLICIHNSAENSWLASQAGNKFWIGYTDMTPYGGGKASKNYGWITGCSSTFTNWAGREPNNAGNNEDWVEVYTDGYWNDNSPNQASKCGCQYNVVQSAPPTDSFGPTAAPSTARPSSNPSRSPAFWPTRRPIEPPTFRPTKVPTKMPTTAPSTVIPTTPSVEPSVNPSTEPTSPPTGPSFTPSHSPSNPTSSPSVRATIRPTRDPSFEPTYYPSYDPTIAELIGERK